MRYILVLLICLSAAGAHAQSEADTTWKIYPPKENQLETVSLADTNRTLVAQPLPGGEGTVKVNVSTSYIDSLRNRYNREGKRAGYRIHIYRSTKSADARTERRNYLYKRDDQQVYVDYSEPYFIVTVGNFRTKLDATRYLMDIRERYPTAYVIRAKIDPVALPDDVLAPETPDGGDVNGSGGR